MFELSFTAAPMHLWPMQNGFSIIASYSIRVRKLAMLLNSFKSRVLKLNRQISLFSVNIYRRWCLCRHVETNKRVEADH